MNKLEQKEYNLSELLDIQEETRKKHEEIFQSDILPYIESNGYKVAHAFLYGQLYTYNELKHFSRLATIKFENPEFNWLVEQIDEKVLGLKYCIERLKDFEEKT